MNEEINDNEVTEMTSAEFEEYLQAANYKDLPAMLESAGMDIKVGNKGKVKVIAEAVALYKANISEEDDLVETLENTSELTAEDVDVDEDIEETVDNRIRDIEKGIANTNLLLKDNSVPDAKRKVMIAKRSELEAELKSLK